MSFSDSISRQRDSSSTDSVDGDSFSTAAAFRLEGKKNRERSTNKWYSEYTFHLLSLLFSWIFCLLLLFFSFSVYDAIVLRISLMSCGAMSKSLEFCLYEQSSKWGPGFAFKPPFWFTGTHPKLSCQLEVIPNLFCQLEVIPVWHWVDHYQLKTGIMIKVIWKNYLTLMPLNEG